MASYEPERRIDLGASGRMRNPTEDERVRAKGSEVLMEVSGGVQELIREDSGVGFLGKGEALTVD